MEAQDLKTLCGCFEGIVTPASADRRAISPIIMATQVDIVTQLRSRSIDYSKLLIEAMKNRGEITHGSFCEYSTLIKRGETKSRKEFHSHRTPAQAGAATIAVVYDAPLLQQFDNLRRTDSRLDNCLVTMERKLATLIQKLPSTPPFLLSPPTTPPLSPTRQRRRQANTGYPSDLGCHNRKASLWLQHRRRYRSSKAASPAPSQEPPVINSNQANQRPHPSSRQPT